MNIPIILKKLATVTTSVALLIAISGCSDVENPPIVGTKDDIKSGEVSAADDGLDRVPALDFEGYNLHIYSQSSDFYHGTLVVDGEDGDVLNDARYNSLRAIEERFNLNVTEVTNQQVSEEPRITILAGDDAYDLINIKAGDAINYAIENLVYIIDDLPYVDLSRPYWSETINNELSIKNESYFAVAPFNLPVYDFSHALIFNKNTINSYGLNDPYKLVTDGEWTIDSFTEMTKEVTHDVNGDGVYDGEDSYGFLAQPKAVLPGFWIAAGENTIKKDDDGILYFSAPGNERFSKIINKVFEITWDNNTWFRNQSTTNHDTLLRNMFKNDQGLFFDTQIYYIRELRDMETDFGILPYPKYTADQAQYYTRVETVFIFTVPVTNTTLERTGAFIEAYACEAANNIIPAYCEIALKTKYSRDNDSIVMLDLIFDRMTIDFGDSVWIANIRDGVMRLMFLNNERDLSSKLASIEAPVNKLIEDTMEAYAKLSS